MILDINLPQRGCFVGLLQRFVVFNLNLLGFTLIFIESPTRLEIILKPRAASILLILTLRIPLPSSPLLA